MTTLEETKFSGTCPTCGQVWRGMKFTDLNFKDRGDGVVGVQAKVEFPNGYGVSVVCEERSYGGPEGLYELAVLHKGDICYDTPITDDVVGHLDEQGVERHLYWVGDLPEKKEEKQP